jgi:hypothetical protein
MMVDSGNARKPSTHQLASTSPVVGANASDAADITIK